MAFDTIYAEGQRRYVESLSSYARQFLDLMKKPDVDSIEGLSPAISIEQKTTSHNPRSTVGTVTEIYDYMRLLWARAGTPYSPATGLPIESQTVSQMVDKVLAMPAGTKLLLLSPIARGKKGEYKKEIEDLRKQGYQRLKIDGTVYDIEETPELNKNQKHDIEVVIDRIVVKEGIAERLAQSFETALKLSDGLVFAENNETHERTTFSSKFACPISGFTIEEIEPRLFSFNNPYGACPHCDGLGASLYMDPDRVVPNQNLSIAQGAILPWFSRKHGFYTDTLRSLCEWLGISEKTPWKDLPEHARDVILYGSGNEPVPMYYPHFQTCKPFEGVINNLERQAQMAAVAVGQMDLLPASAPQNAAHAAGDGWSITGKGNDNTIQLGKNWFTIIGGEEYCIEFPDEEEEPGDEDKEYTWSISGSTSTTVANNDEHKDMYKGNGNNWFTYIDLSNAELPYTATLVSGHNLTNVGSVTISEAKETGKLTITFSDDMWVTEDTEVDMDDNGKYVVDAKESIKIYGSDEDPQYEFKNQGQTPTTNYTAVKTITVDKHDYYYIHLHTGKLVVTEVSEATE